MSEINGTLIRYSKGNHHLFCFKCLVSREIVQDLNLKVGDGLLLKYNELVFPTVLSKQSSEKSFTYAFTVPRKIGKVINSKCPKFILVSSSTNHRKISFPIERIDLFSNISNKTRHEHPIYIFDLGDKVYVWVFSRGSKGFLLNRFIPLEKSHEFDFLELMGALFCEGKRWRKKGKRNLDSMIFSNADPEQIIWFANSLNIFGFSLKDIKLQILHNPSNDPIAILNFWISKGFSKGNIKLYVNNTVKSQTGVCLLILQGVTLGELFYELLRIATKLALKSKDNACRFFRGLSRGDIGIISTNRWNSHNLACVNYTSGYLEDVKLFITICKQLNIQTDSIRFHTGKNGYWSVDIHGYKNFKTILELNLITHSIRKKKMIKLFLNCQKSAFFKYLEALSLGFNTSKSISEHISMAQVTVQTFLRNLRHLGYIKKFGFEDKPQYKLTKKGKECVAFYNKIKSDDYGH